MISSLRFHTIVALLVFVPVMVRASVIREGSLGATSDGSFITIRWVSEDENGVLRYEIERQAGTNGQFIYLDQVQLRGNNEAYTYVDESAVLRGTENLYKYRIKVIFSNGASEYYGPISVTHVVNSVRRTWGSIKAMFR
jgi:hypothetical protein